MTDEAGQPKTGRGLDGAKAWRIAAWGGAAALWLAPLVAMRFTAEVRWTAFDFAVWGAMLIAACGAFELALRAPGGWAYKLGAGLAVGTAFVLLWADLAVGIIGDENSPANGLFVGVIAVAAAGAALARMRPAGLARAMLAAAIAQVLAPILAINLFLHGPIAEAAPVAVFTAILTAAWLVSAWLFRRAA